MMKRLNVLYLFLALTLVLGSCGSSNNVVSNKLISKRKYNKGFHINKKGNYKDSKKNVASEDLKADDAKSTDEKLTPTRASRKDWKEKFAPVTIERETESEAVAEVESYTEEIPSSDSHQSDDINTVVETESNTESSENESSEDAKASSLESKGYLSSPSTSDPVMLVIYILLCLFLPPVAIAIYSGISGIFWLDLILFLLAISSFFWIPTVGLVGLAAIIIAFLVVWDVI